MSKPHASSTNNKVYKKNYDEIDWGPRVKTPYKRRKKVAKANIYNDIWSRVYSGR